MSRSEPGIKPEYDMIIVGGGFYGAALCWMATCAGLRVALYERNDYASGASSNSLKTVHGGIRYLQKFNVKRTLKSIRERNRLVGWFSHSVKPLHCVMPVYTFSIKNPLTVWMGFKFYQWLSRQAGTQEDCYSRAGLIRQLDRPCSRYQNPLGYAYWCDPQAQYPERMVVDLLMSARAKGATVRNYLAVSEVEQGPAGEVVCHLGNVHSRVSARVVVDCTGGWKLAAAHCASENTRYVRAVNLIFDRHISDQACTLEGAQSSSRFLFLCPWRQHTMVGTWYLYGNENPTDLSLSKSELDAMLAEVNERLLQRLERHDVVNVHVGLLPLAADPGNEALLGNSLSDSSVCYSSEKVNNLFRIEGIKFTTALADAGEAFKKILKASGLDSKANTEKLDNPNSTVMIPEDLEAALKARYEWCDNATVAHLVSVYGAKADQILALADQNESWRRPIAGFEQALVAEVFLALDFEDSRHLTDVVVRRTGLGVGAMPAKSTAEDIAQLMATHHDWDALRRQDELNQLWSSYPNFNETQE